MKTTNTFLVVLALLCSPAILTQGQHATESDETRSTGNVGIGTTTPSALLHTNGLGTGEGNVLFTGELKVTGQGDPPATGMGTRLMWYPDKAAFRAGRITSTGESNWDKANIGNHSIAFGSNTLASGNAAFATGTGSSATGGSSVAMGWNPVASGSISIALGNVATASGNYSTAMGSNTTAYSAYETVIGRYSAVYTPQSATGWDNADRLFVIGNGTGDVSRSNAVTVMKSGNVGIGTNAPTQKLDIDGRLRLRGGSPGAGRVLISDPDGVASWADPAVETDPTWSGPANTTDAAGRTGPVGVGTTTPIEGLHISGVNLLATGVHGSSPVLPSIAAFAKMFFYPRKSAFRAGFVNSNQWDDVNIGDYSVAMGIGTIASGARSTALGNATEASGDYSTSLGRGTIASGGHSTAMGVNSRASGNFSFAIHLSGTTGPGVPANTFQISGATNIIVSEGNVGIGTNAPTQKMDVNGQLRLRGGSPGAGKVLVSDADGVASWTDPAAETDPTWSGPVNTTGAIGRTGDVGIGTDSPSAKLHVDGGDALIYGHRMGRGGGSQIENVAVGFDALNINSSGQYNTAIGYKALTANTSGNGNIANGHETLLTNSNGNHNIAMGFNALRTNSSGNNNIAIGQMAMDLNSLGNKNIAIGQSSLGLSTSGNENIAIGNSALLLNSSGHYNVAIGEQALKNSGNGDKNTAVGYQALLNNSSGYGNTVLGASSMTTNTTGFNNTVVGSWAGGGQNNLTNCTFIGHGAEANVNNLQNTTAIGRGAQVSTSNTVRLGNDDVQSLYCIGAYNGTVGSTNRDVFADSDGKIGYVSSSRRYKENISDMANVNWLYELRPVSFTYKSDGLKKTQYGLIAEEVEYIFQEMVSYDQEGRPETVSYSSLISPLLKAVQEQKALIDQLQQKVEELENALKVVR